MSTESKVVTRKKLERSSSPSETGSLEPVGQSPFNITRKKVPGFSAPTANSMFRAYVDPRIAVPSQTVTPKKKALRSSIPPMRIPASTGSTNRKRQVKGISNEEGTELFTHETINLADLVDPSSPRNKARKRPRGQPTSDSHTPLLQDLADLSSETDTIHKPIRRRKKTSKIGLPPKSGDSVAVAEIEDFLGQPTSIKKKSSKMEKTWKERLEESQSERSTDDLSVGSFFDLTSDLSSDTGDLFFSSHASPKHEYPILDENNFQDVNFNAIAYVHSALSAWAKTRRRNSQSTIPSKTVKEASEDTLKECEGSKVNDPEPVAPSTISEERIKKGKAKSKKSRSRVIDPVPVASSVTNDVCPEQMAATTIKSSEKLNGDVIKLDINGNVESELANEVTNLTHPHLPEALNQAANLKNLFSVSVQTLTTGHQVSVQTENSLTNLELQSTSRSRSKSRGQGVKKKVRISKTRKSDSTQDSPDCQLKKTESQRSTKQSHAKSSSMSINEPDTISQASLTSVKSGVGGQVDTLVVKSTEKLDSKNGEIDLIPSNDLKIKSASGDEELKIFSFQTEQGIPQIPIQNDNVPLIKKDPIAMKEVNEKVNVMGDVKSFQDNLGHFIDLVGGLGPVDSETVGVCGVAKTWSLTSYGHPCPMMTETAPPNLLISCPIDPFIPPPGYSTSTQTIDEMNTETQIGHSLTAFEGYDEDDEEWDDEAANLTLETLANAKNFIDTQNLFENVPETIVNGLQELNLGSNIEKMSDTISTTLRAVTEIITEMVSEEPDDPSEDREVNDFPLPVLVERTSQTTDKKIYDTPCPKLNPSITDTSV